MNMTTIEESIDKFCGYFYGQIESIRSLITLEGDGNTRDIENFQIKFYKKVLLITALDTLACIRFPKQRFPSLNKNNRSRFIRFLEVSKCWQSGELVSIPFLFENKDKGSISDGLLRFYIKNILKKFNANETTNIPSKNIDQPKEALFELATTEQEEKAIMECQHYELLYRYRNYLIHESREPGNAMDILPDENDPYYHSYVGQKKYVLTYPLDMFIKILENAVDYISKYLKNHKLNPYDFVEETDRW
jgi:hypothetical protein